MDEYFMSLETSAADFERKQSDINGILAEIEAFSGALSSFTEKKYGVGIRLKIVKISNPTLSPIAQAATAASATLRGTPGAHLTPYLCLVNNFGKHSPVNYFSLSEQGYPAIGRVGADEITIKNLAGVKAFLKKMSSTFSFHEALKSFVSETLEAGKQMKDAEESEQETKNDECK